MARHRMLLQLPESFVFDNEVVTRSVKALYSNEDDLYLRKLANQAERSRQKKTQRKDRKHNLLPYITTSKQLQHLRQHKKCHQKNCDSKFSSKFANKLLVTCQNETRSAIYIQKLYRRCLAVKRVCIYRKKVSASRKIQANIRCFLARRWFIVWSNLFVVCVVKCQSFLRGCRCRQYVNGRRAIEAIAATRIQCLVRRCLAINRYQIYHLNTAAIRIQCAWRCLFSRNRMTRNRLCAKAQIVQQYIRRYLTSISYRRLKARVELALLILQRVWRGYTARCRTSLLLHKDCLHQRKLQVYKLTAEASYWSEKCVTLEREYGSSDGVQKLEALRKNVNDTYADIKENERCYIELRKERESLSPRGISEGWGYDLDERIRKHRGRITQGKVDVLFRNGLKLRAIEENAKKQQQKLADARNNAERYTSYREEEIKQLWLCQNKFVKMFEDRERRKCIADERRKWAVTFSTPFGKPLKMKKTTHDNDEKGEDTDLEAVHALVQKNQEVNMGTQLILYQQLYDQFSKVNNVLLESKIKTKGPFQEKTRIEVDYKKVPKQDLTSCEVMDRKRNQHCETSLPATGRKRGTIMNKVPWKMLDLVDAAKYKFEQSVLSDRLTNSCARKS